MTSIQNNPNYSLQATREMGNMMTNYANSTQAKTNTKDLLVDASGAISHADLEGALTTQGKI